MRSRGPRLLVSIVAVAVAVTTAGCGKKKRPRFEGALPITFGDCAARDVKWTSGPRPLGPPVAPPPSPPAAPPTSDDPALARQQAIAQARQAGILGSPSRPEDGAFRGEHAMGFGASNRPTPELGSTVSIGQPNAAGDLDKAIIRRYIKREIPKITACYETQLLAKPELAGTVNTSFFIAPDGKVQHADAVGVAPEVASCVAAVIATIEFPKPKGGGGVQVNYPFMFRQAGAAPAVEATAPPAPPPPPKPPAAQLAAAITSNPLRDERDLLTECFRQNPEPYGVAVVELAYDPSGKVTNAIAHGLTDDDTATCVVAAARQAMRGSGAPPAQRCALAFGEMPLSAAPALDITADTIQLTGTPLVTTKAVAADPGPSWSVAAVFTAIAARVKQTTDASAPVVAIRGPLVVRPVDSTAMKVVYHVLSTVIEGGDDFVLAAQRGTGWTLLAPLKLPVVPVPIGTGGAWNRVTGGGGAAGAGDDEAVHLSVYVTKDQVWVGLSRVSEFQETSRDALRGTLKDQKASTFFADRTDAEIAADDDVPYADVVAAIAALQDAGFADWRLTDPAGLSARPTL